MCSLKTEIEFTFRNRNWLLGFLCARLKIIRIATFLKLPFWTAWQYKTSHFESTNEILFAMPIRISLWRFNFRTDICQIELVKHIHIPSVYVAFIVNCNTDKYLADDGRRIPLCVNNRFSRQKSPNELRGLHQLPNW